MTPGTRLCTPGYRRSVKTSAAKRFVVGSDFHFRRGEALTGREWANFETFVSIRFGREIRENDRPLKNELFAKFVVADTAPGE